MTEHDKAKTRAKAVTTPLSFRSDSEKSRVAEDTFLRADDGCVRSLTAFEMTVGEGRDDSGGRSR